MSLAYPAPSSAPVASPTTNTSPRPTTTTTTTTAAAATTTVPIGIGAEWQTVHVRAPAQQLRGLHHPSMAPARGTVAADVSSLDVSPDGSLGVSASGSQVLLWSTSDGQRLVRCGASHDAIVAHSHMATPSYVARARGPPVRRHALRLLPFGPRGAHGGHGLSVAHLWGRGQLRSYASCSHSQYVNRADGTWPTRLARHSILDARWRSTCAGVSDMAIIERGRNVVCTHHHHHHQYPNPI